MYQNMAQVRAANAEANHHFFDRSTMRFFASRIVSTLYKNQTFITREKTGFDSTRHAYSVRLVRPDGKIETLSAFNAYSDIDDARAFARAY